MVSLIGAGSNLASESQFTNFRNTWRRGRTLYPRFFVHLSMPEPLVESATALLDDDERQYIEIIPEKIPVGYRVQECLFDPDLALRFNRYSGRSWVDLVVCARLPIGFQLQLALRDWRGPGGAPRVTMYEPGIDQDFSLPVGRAWFADFCRLAKTISVATCPTQLLTDTEIGLARDWSRRWLSPALQDDLVTHTAKLSPPLPLPSAFPEKAPEKHVLFFGGRMNQVVKRINWIMDMYEHVFSLGADVEIVMTSPSEIKIPVKTYAKGKGKGKDGQPLFRMINKCGREQFIEEASKASVCVVASEYEAYPVGFAQIAGAGCLTLFPDRPWARSMMPDTYPWFYKTEAEALALVTRALRGEWLSMVKKQLTSMQSNDKFSGDYDEQRWKFWDHESHRIPSRTRGTGGGDIPRFVADFIDRRESFTLEEVCDEITSKATFQSKRSWDAPPATFWSRSWVHQMLMQCGFADACDGPEVRYVKETTFPTEYFRALRRPAGSSGREQPVSG
jgi:hypothetical protein